jgi:CP family cyanate transporter-like MFS transporter
VLFGALIGVSAGLLLRGALPRTLLFPGSVLALGSIALMNVLLSSMIKRRWPERAGLLIGVYLTALSTGAVIASLVSVPLFNGSGGSVELTLGLWGLPAVAATLMWISQLRYGPPPRLPAAAAGAARLPGPRLYRYPLAWQVTAFMGLQSLLYYAAVSWMPELFRDRGDSASTAGVLLAAMGLGNLLTSLVTPTLAHRFASQRSIVAPAVVVTAVGLAGSLWAPLGSAVVWMVILGAAQGAALGLGIFFTMGAPSPPAACPPTTAESPRIPGCDAACRLDFRAGRHPRQFVTDFLARVAIRTAVSGVQIITRRTRGPVWTSRPAGTGRWR